jgi:hypothetical protein
MTACLRSFVAFRWRPAVNGTSKLTPYRHPKTDPLHPGPPLTVMELGLWPDPSQGVGRVINVEDWRSAGSIEPKG